LQSMMAQHSRLCTRMLNSGINTRTHQPAVRADFGFKTTQLFTVCCIDHILVTSQLFTCQRAWRRPQSHKPLQNNNLQQPMGLPIKNPPDTRSNAHLTDR